VNATKVVIGKMQSNRKLKIIEFLGKGVRQACEPANCHPDRHVLTLDKTSRDVAFAGVSDSHFGYNLDDWAWGVPFSYMLAVVAIELRKLREVHIQAKRFLDYLGVEVEAVRRQLDLIGKPFVKVGDKRSRVLDGALADAERCDQLSFRIHRNEYPLIADLAVAVAYLALLLLDERPDFIALYIATLEAVQSRIQQLSAALTSNFQKSYDRVSVEAGEPFRTANGAPFNETLNGANRGVFAGTHRAKRGLGLRFGKRCRAGIATPALDSTFAVSTEPLAGDVLASDACHGLFSACVEREKPYNEIGSGVRLTPRSGLAPQPVSAGYGAVSCYSANWWRSSHVLPPSCRDRSALLPLGGSYLTPKSFLLVPIGRPRRSRGAARSEDIPQRVLLPFVGYLTTPNYKRSLSCPVNTLQDRVNRSRRVGVACQVEAHGGQSLLNISRSKRFTGGSQHFTHCVCESFGSDDLIQLVKVGHHFFLIVKREDAQQTRLNAFQPLLNLEFLAGQSSQCFQVILNDIHFRSAYHVNPKW
jgi:hypothetical protein